MTNDATQEKQDSHAGKVRAAAEEQRSSRGGQSLTMQGGLRVAALLSQLTLARCFVLCHRWWSGTGTTRTSTSFRPADGRWVRAGDASLLSMRAPAVTQSWV